MHPRLYTATASWKELDRQSRMIEENSVAVQKENSLNEKLSKLSVSEMGREVNEDDCLKWELPLNEIYRLALKFYKDKSGKAIHLSYEENLKLVALTMQANHGNIQTQKLEPLGVFDVIGKHRREQWAQLSGLSKLQSQESFIDLLDRLCPAFKPYIEAIKKDREEKRRQAAVEEARRVAELEVELKKQEEEKVLQIEQHREELQKRKLQDALNQQTFHQFKEYAEKQFPGNPEQQGVLIKQLQTEHYNQYLQQLQAQFQHGDLLNFEESRGGVGGDDINSSSAVSTPMNAKEQQVSLHDEREKCDSDDESNNGEFATVQPASMWTRSDLKDFKQEVIAAGGDGVIRVGHGDCVTVRVPTLEGGTSLFWEFSTDSYDIGFGVYFEWAKPDTTEVSVHVSESDDEFDENEDGDAQEDEEITCADDLESGTPLQVDTSTSSIFNRPPLSIIVPVYRRECQNEVYAGSHNYPGEGTYLLKFDNTYSLWRSKTLYYRIFYTR